MGSSNGHVAVVQALVAAGADIRAADKVSIHKGVGSGELMDR
jgi:hypothetical protein